MLIEMDEMVIIYSDGTEYKSSYSDEDVDQLLKAWAADAAYFKQQPGFISTQLHRGIGGSCVFINYAVWESTQQFKEAFNRPEFKSKLGAYPDSTTTSPHLFKKVAVSGSCGDQECTRL